MVMFSDLQCKKCGYQFTKKSSLVRHSKRCSDGLVQNLRQKACQECSSSKTRCDLKRPSCSRCLQRRTRCVYRTAIAIQDVGSGVGSITPIPEPSSTTTIAVPHIGPMGAASNIANHPVSREAIDYTSSILSPDNISLTPLLQNVAPFSSILDPMLEFLDSLRVSPHSDDQPPPGGLSALPSIRTTPILTRNSMQLLLRVFRTWPRMIAKGLQMPPILHSMQLSDTTTLPIRLVNCFTLAKMWDGQCDGASNIVCVAIKKEVQALFNEYRNLNKTDLVAALQAMALYTIMLLFPSRDHSSVTLLDTNFGLQLKHFITYVSTTGLILPEETNHIRPTWYAWINITAKRRAALALYLIYWSYSVYHCLPTFGCRDLGFMPAPAAKYLWLAQDKNHWESLYNRWLSQWDGADLYQWEFSNIIPGIRMDSRVELWLEDADEFGILLLAIINATQREPEFQVISL
ncbi:hypothetical protein AJ80_07257 [Polytolypa hystricis UAMH7299]|uniref:Zn(2)-C6 fungal-type domain-containing protein n=1 Tax=Polytolypa hystricis (strain UAMH7299) TaxID=1447883 RepID=A0A2B7XQC5_POLH7|nr:hypothetical protein AJ80_07257 [Polytolypa hystricis UAMH7299]